MLAISRLGQVVHPPVTASWKVLPPSGPWRPLTTQQLATALRPFYFAVHPDLFGQHPEERKVNENSLKQLQVLLESAQRSSHHGAAEGRRLTFYLRPRAPSSSPTPSPSLRLVEMTLKGRDIKTLVHQVLSTCQLPTTYLDALTPPPAAKPHPPPSSPWNEPRHEMPTRRTQESLRGWLAKNAPSAKSKLDAMRPIRVDAEKLREALCRHLGLQDLLWKCGWGITHFKACLQSLEALCTQHPEVHQKLKGRTVVFGNLTGVSLDGHVILSSGDVRNSWLDLLKRVEEEEVTLERIPAVENAVSQVLRGIRVVHRKFQPVVTARNYEVQLRTLSAALADFWVKHGYPASWPSSMDTFQLVVECDASPLMLSPTGQFIVPSSCPAFLIVRYINDNLIQAQNRLNTYKELKSEEISLHERCIRELALRDLQKDDNVTPDRMIQCCRRLLRHALFLLPHLQGTSLYVTHYYSLLHDGEMCVPWNWEG